MIDGLKRVFTILAIATLVVLPGCGGDNDGKIVVAFVTNNADPFWDIAKAGARQAEKEFDVECRFLTPGGGQPDDMKRVVETLLTDAKVSGMAISPIDSKNQTEMLDRAAAKMDVICHDSDAPDSKRLCYVGTLNVDAGREAGKLIKEVLPNGGKVMLFVGFIDAQNAIERRQGIQEVIEGTGIEIVNTLTDQKDAARAKSNVEDTITGHPEVMCLVGLWSYNGPAILSAVKDADKLGKINIVTFDEADDTLQGVMDGHIHATVVQQPYMFGYESVRILAALARGDKSVIPANKINAIPVKIVRKDNVKDFWEDLKKLKSGG